MALIDTASLIVTPNGYKTSKLYSIVPSDGTGDMTFARTGNTATRVNSSGLIETVNANIPRLDYLDSTCPKLLLEPQRTNLILQSQDISSASWSKTTSPTIVTNVAVSPDGTTTADSIQSVDTSGFKSIKQTNTFATNSTFTFSFFVKKETSRTNYGGVGFSITGGTTKSVFVIFDETNGTQINLSNSTLTPTLKTEIYGNYYRFSITVTDNGSNTSVTTEIYSTLSVNGTSFGIGIGSARTIWGMQLEVGAFATSYIPTTTASVTRNADFSNKTSISALLNASQGTILFKYQNIKPSSSGSTVPFEISNGTDTSKIGLFINATAGRIRLRITITGFISEIETASYTTTDLLTIVVRYSSTDLTLWINGTLVSTQTSPVVMSALDRITFGQWWGGTLAEGKLEKFAYWKTALTNSECLTLSQS